MLSIESRTKFALYGSGRHVTDFVWNKAKECNGYIVLYNENTLAIYDKSSEEEVLHIEDFEEIKFAESHLYIQSKGEWGVYEYSGKEVVPIKYDHINACIYSPTTLELMAVSVDVGYEDGGYYIVSTNTYYEADDINITKTNKIELLKKGEWTMLE